MEREFLSLPEAAAILGISRIAVFKRVKSGKLAAIRVGRNWAVAYSLVEALADEPSKGKRGRRPSLKSEAFAAETDREDSSGMGDIGWD